MKTLFLLIVMMCMLTSISLTGCYSTGKVAGEAVEETEGGYEDLKEGYKEGRKEDPEDQ